MTPHDRKCSRVELSGRPSACAALCSPGKPPSSTPSITGPGPSAASPQSAGALWRGRGRRRRRRRFGAVGAAAARRVVKKRKNSESGRETSRVSLPSSPAHRPASSGRTRRSPDPGRRPRRRSRCAGRRPRLGCCSTSRLASATMTTTSRSASARMRCAACCALRADFGRLALTLGLHALVDRLAVGVRQIGAADADVDDLDAEASAPRGSPASRDALHQRGALVANHLR